MEFVAQGIAAGLEVDWEQQAESPPGGFPLSASLYDLASKALPIARDPAEVAAEFLPSALRVVSRRTPPGRDALDAIAEDDEAKRFRLVAMVQAEAEGALPAGYEAQHRWIGDLGYRRETVS